MPLSTGSAILDVGAGTGFLSLELAQRCGPKSRVVAVDSWGDAVARFRRKISALGLGNIELIEADAASLALPAESLAWRFADGSSLLRHAFIRLGFLPAWQSLVEASARERVFAALEAALNAAAAARGELALTIPVALVEARKPA